MSEVIHFEENNAEAICVIGVRVYADSDSPDLYSIVLYNEAARGDRNRPIVHDGRIVFFAAISERNAALRLGDRSFRKYGSIDAEVGYVYDIPGIVRLLETGERDDPGTLADTLNEILDFIDATGRPLPEGYRRTLYTLADATTFDKDLSNLFNTGHIERAEALNALFWAIGVITAHSKVI